MLITSFVLIAGAMLVWPPGGARRRLYVLCHTRTLRRGIGLPRLATPLFAACGAVAGLLAAGVGGGVAGMVVALTVWRRWRARRAEREHLRVVDGLAEALALLVAELRAGAHPADAATGAAQDAQPLAAGVLNRVAVTAKLGGDVAQALQRGASGNELVSGALGQLARAWALAHRHGLPLAEVLDAVRRDLDQQVRFAGQVHARMAGPRASATVLAVLPLLGVLLGEAIGASPLHVLAATAPGQGLLVVGMVAVCTGVQWSARLTGRAVWT
jgi:tight adherence protein B